MNITHFQITCTPLMFILAEVDVYKVFLETLFLISMNFFSDLNIMLILLSLEIVKIQNIFINPPDI